MSIPFTEEIKYCSTAYAYYELLAILWQQYYTTSSHFNGYTVQYTLPEL
jgi:hypothetical protein